MQQKATEKGKAQVQGMAQAVPVQEVEKTGNGQKTLMQKTVTADDLQETMSEDYQFNLSDFALFMSVMKVKEAYEDVLSIILDELDLRLREVKVEQVVLNKSGRRAIRLDAWAHDVRDRQFDMEMQNDTEGDDIRKRSRFYQSMIDTPILKAGKETRYKHLPSTTIIFITQEDIFGKDLAMYTFSERCEEVPELSLKTGTSKIFLNMTSKNGRPELISLLQYMRHTTLDNESIIVRDKRIVDLDRIVGEVKRSEEWEAVKMNILEIGIAKGKELGLEEGRLNTLVENVESAMKNLNIDLHKACEALGTSIEEYENAKRQVTLWKNGYDAQVNQ